MDFRQLNYVITVARERTLSAAAEKLYLTPSALSQHIAHLEDELQASLFQRTKTGWVPTPVGQLYIEMAESILDQQTRTYRQIGDILGQQIGSFTVGINPGHSAQMFSAIYPKFKKKYPGVQISLKEGSVMEISGLISANKVDLGFITSELDYPGVETQAIAREEILLAVPAGHPLAERAAHVPGEEPAVVDLKLLEQEDFLLGDKQTILRLVADRAFYQAGFAPRVVFESASMSTLYLLAQSGYGICFIPRSYTDAGSLAVYFRTEPPVTWERVVAYRKNHYLSNAEKYLISLARAYYQTSGWEML